MKAIIICGGDVGDYEFYKQSDFDGAYIICADGGLKHCKKLNIRPDLIVGDNDSWTEQYPAEIESVVSPPEKDYTDTNICIDEAIERGFKEIMLIGALGGRRDHEFSHFCLLAYGLKRGVKIKILDRYNEIWMEDKPFELFRGSRKYVSFFPFGGDVEEFTVRGLKYEAEKMRLACDEVRASSNEFDKCDAALISFKSGRVIVMLCDDRAADQRSESNAKQV